MSPSSWIIVFDRRKCLIQGKSLNQGKYQDIFIYNGRRLYQYNEDDFLLIMPISNCKCTCKQREAVN